MKIKRLLSVFLTIITLANFGQDIENIETERPDQGNCTSIIPAGKFQIENGIYCDSFSQINNFFLRIGTGFKTEVRILIDASISKHQTGFLPLGISVKRSICAQHKWIPATSLAGYYYIGSLASLNYYKSINNYSIVGIFQNQLDKHWSISYNLGNSDFKKNVMYTASCCFAPSKKITLFAELFGQFYLNRYSVHGTDCGLLFFLKPNMQFDIAAGIPLLNNEITSYLTFGYSILFKNKSAPEDKNKKN